MQNKPKAAIILAPDAKGSQPLFGIPSIRRLTLLTLQTGLTAVHVIGNRDELSPILADLIPESHFHALEGPAFLDEVVDGMSLPDDARVAVFRSNLVIDRKSLMRLLETEDRPGPCLMEAPETGGLGVYLVHPCDLSIALRALWLEDASLLVISAEARKVYGAKGLPYIMEEGKAQTKVSEARLVGALSFQTEGDDGFLARHFDRPISRSISRRLAHTAVTPNAITLMGVAIGLFGAFLLSRPGYWAQLTGSFLFLACVVVDGVDGEVARLKLKETRFGHYLDVVTDNLVHIAVFVGIAFGLFKETADPEYLYALGLLMGGFGLCIIAVFQCILKLSTDELKRSPGMIRFMALLTNRDFAYLLVLLAALHRLNWFLMGAAVGAYLFAFALWGMSFHGRRVVANRIP
jgi:phosphatidylglycerophosphate synthase